MPVPHEILKLVERQTCPATPWRSGISATDMEIDKLVYELYGLTDSEIAIVEQSGGK
jgi:hypothetical protein